MKGTCLAESECTSKSGTVDGNCAAGFGVCCSFTLSTCGSTVTQNCTYIQNPSYPTTFTTSGACAYTVTPLSSDICQLRLDFDNFDITEDTTTGACTDTFEAKGPTGRNPMSLCGTATGQHLYVEQGRSTTPTTLTFTIATGGTWKIKVSQIECSSLMRAKPGCDQWFTGLSGTFQSYNWPTVPIQAKSYAYCFRSEAGYCHLDYNQFQPFTSPDSFAIDNANNDKSHNSATFGEGWLDIAGNDQISHVSGDVFSAATGTHIATEATPSTVTVTGGNYVVTYNTLGNSQVSSDNKGFKLTYTHVPC